MADNSHFFAHLARMKLIHRWPLMHNVRIENVQEHSLQVAMVTHALALIRNRYFGGDLNPERIATLAMFHDVSEVLTGDLPTPVKYFNPAIKDEYKKIEKIAEPFLNRLNCSSQMTDQLLHLVALRKHFEQRFLEPSQLLSFTFFMAYLMRPRT